MPTTPLRPTRARSRVVAALALSLILIPATASMAQSGPAEGKAGLVELGATDPRLKGHYAPKGFKVEIIAAEPTIVDPTGLAFDDRGNLYVSEWKYADHMLDTWDTLKLPEGGTTRVQRRRKSTTDVVKRLGNRDANGVYQSAEVVVDGAEMPASIFPWKNSLYLTCVGKLERWSDEDGDGKFEQRTILADGFCGFYHHWLSGMTLGPDGWFYLTAGDNDNHVVGSDGSRVEVSRCGAIVRGKVDGSRMNLFAMGFRNPYRDVALNATFDVFHVDNDQEEGSKFQGVRLINPVEGGDYGWRLRPGASCCQTDFDRGAVSGELPGKLPIIAKTGRGAPAGLLIYNGASFPEKYRGLLIYPDVFRKSVRGYRVAPKGGTYALQEEITLMTADDDLFRPCQAVLGPDGAIYVVDWRSNSGGAGRLWGDQKYGRIYKITWEGDGETPALPIAENNWKRVLEATDEALLAMIRGTDENQGRRALREFVDRSCSVLGGRELANAGTPDGEFMRARQASRVRSSLVGLLDERDSPLHARILALQGLRQLWGDEVEAEMVRRLSDRSPEVRRLAAQALNWEPKAPRPGLIPRLVEQLGDPDDHVLRDVALAIGRHGQGVPVASVGPLLGWLLAHPSADVTTRDAFIRGLERLDEPGIAAVAEMVRKPGRDRAQAVAIFTAFRSPIAASKLPSLATVDGLPGPERAALVRQMKDIPLNIPVPTQPIADWIVAHREAEPEVKVASLDVCRLAGNPDHGLVLALLGDPDESVRLAAAQLAAQVRPQGAIEVMADRLTRPETSTTERIALAKALRVAGPAAFPALESAFAVARDPDFRKVALRALADADRGRSSVIVEAALSPENPPEVRAEAIGILGEAPQTAMVLGRAYLDGKLTRSDLPSVRTVIRKFDSAEHKDLSAKIDAAVESGMAKLSVEDVKNRLDHGADPWSGLDIYRRESGARCFACHKIEGYGGAVGPDLSGVSGALSVDKMIESILEPSKEIKEGYESYKVALKNGRVLLGIKVAQDASNLVLRDSNGQETRVPLAEIEEQVRDSASIMPVGLVADLSAAELGDLIAFLRNKPVQESLKNAQKLDHWVGIGPFATSPDDPAVPLDRIDLGAAKTGQGGSTLTWQSMDVSSRGTLNLRGQFGPTPGRAYLATKIRSEGPQAAGFRLAVAAPARVFLNGAKVADLAPSTRLAPASGRLIPLPLKDGENTLIVALDRPAADFEAVAEIQSARPVEAKP